MKSKIWLALFSLLTVLSLALAACGPQATPEPAEEPTAVEEPAEEETEGTTEETEEESSEDSKRGGTLRIGYHQENDTLNPFTSQMTGEATLPMIEGLVMSNNKNTYIPILAEEIPTYDNGGIQEQEDGTIEMTWDLREGVQWHDGEDFTSEDVCFTWEWLVSDGATMVYNQNEYKNILDCEMPDDHTVVFTWDGPYAPYATLFDALLPEHILAGQDVATYDAYNRSPIGTGPFKFEEWKAGEYLRLVRNENYWRGPDYPYLDELVYYFVPDPNTRMNGIKAGEYDIAELNAEQAEQIEDLDGYRVEVVDRNIWIWFGTAVNSERTQQLFGDQQVRQALFYAIDREAIVNDLLQGTVSIAYTPITPSSPYHNPDVEKYEYDPDLAREMLADAGWEDTDGDGILDKDGLDFSFTFLNRASRPQRVAIAQVIQQQFKDIGIEVDFETKEDKAWVETWVSGEWDATIGGWILPADPSFTGLYGCDESNNMTGHCSPELDEVMHEADTTLAFEERKELMFQAQEMLLEEAVEMPIHYVATPFALNAGFGNFKGSGTNLGSFWNTYEWYLEQ